ncbi:alpha/beta hydrolase [Planobispora longispora]|uniref:Peptidase n=1 Tax=Planobispora longispora TaxID=28887 RepID=A0A8J3RT30_9ACTN|nr:alpha/beta hydrolase [Planobispora longispora]GIH80699.1 peptidase [Planobispora longispora]
MKRVVGVVTGAMLLAATAGAPPQAVARTHHDGLTWGPCETGDGRAGDTTLVPSDRVVECATLRVPLDYREPYQTISIALNRIKGTASRDRDHLGALLVNPGGPGASGLLMAQYVAAKLPARLAERFDVIGFDPRGVGRSEPALRCADPAEHYAAPRPDNVPRNAQEESVLLDRARRYADACAMRWSWLLPHVTTENTARDMDRIRQALGEEKISFLGYSYGTYLGSVYATLFPGRVKRLVLDSAVDPRHVWYESNLRQNAAFDRRHRDFLRWTARHNDVYRLGKTGREVSFAWYSTRQRLRARPAGGVIGPSEFDDVYTVGGYSDTVWPQLAQALSAYVRRGDAEPLVSAHRRYAAGDAEEENGYAVYLAVQCGEAHWPRDWRRWKADTTAIHARSPFMAWSNTWFNAPCGFWSGRGATPVPIRNDRRLPPALIIQSRWDAATPYPGALELRRVFARSRMVTEPGGNHGVSLAGNACVDRHLAAYLRDGVVPGPARRAPSGPDARCATTPAPQPAEPVRQAARMPASPGLGR